MFNIESSSSIMISKLRKCLNYNLSFITIRKTSLHKLQGDFPNWSKTCANITKVPQKRDWLQPTSNIWSSNCWLWALKCKKPKHQQKLHNTTKWMIRSRDISSYGAFPSWIILYKWFVWSAAIIHHRHWFCIHFAGLVVKTPQILYQILKFPINIHNKKPMRKIIIKLWKLEKKGYKMQQWCLSVYGSKHLKQWVKPPILECQDNRILTP